MSESIKIIVEGGSGGGGGVRLRGAYQGFILQTAETVIEFILSGNRYDVLVYM